MHQYKGRMIIHTGSMFSGKTSSLERDLKRFRIAGYKTIAFKPAIDTRGEKSQIITHDNTFIQGVSVESIKEVEDYVETQGAAVIGIDEVQFLKGGIETIKSTLQKFLARDYIVVLAGLDMDFEGKPFEVIKELLPVADYVHKHHAVCAKCGTDAWVSHRKSEAKDRVVIGAMDEYEPLCRRCYEKEKSKRESKVNLNQMKLDL